MSADFIAGVAELKRGIKTLQTIPMECLDWDELIELKHGLEQAASMAHDVQLRIIGGLQRSVLPVAFGGTDLAVILSTGWGSRKPRRTAGSQRPRNWATARPDLRESRR
jgi:hypothetical protein